MSEFFSRHDFNSLYKEYLTEFSLDMEDWKLSPEGLKPGLDGYDILLGVLRQGGFVRVNKNGKWPLLVKDLCVLEVSKDSELPRKLKDYYLIHLRVFEDVVAVEAKKQIMAPQFHHYIRGKQLPGTKNPNPSIPVVTRQMIDASVKLVSTGIATPVSIAPVSSQRISSRKVTPRIQHCEDRVFSSDPETSPRVTRPSRIRKPPAMFVSPDFASSHGSEDSAVRPSSETPATFSTSLTTPIVPSPFPPPKPIFTAPSFADISELESLPLILKKSPFVSAVDEPRIEKDKIVPFQDPWRLLSGIQKDNYDPGEFVYCLNSLIVLSSRGHQFSEIEAFHIISCLTSHIVKVARKQTYLSEDDTRIINAMAFVVLCVATSDSYRKILSGVRNNPSTVPRPVFSNTNLRRRGRPPKDSILDEPAAEGPGPVASSRNIYYSALAVAAAHVSYREDGIFEVESESAHDPNDPVVNSDDHLSDDDTSSSENEDEDETRIKTKPSIPSRTPFDNFLGIRRLYGDNDGAFSATRSWSLLADLCREVKDLMDRMFSIFLLEEKNDKKAPNDFDITFTNSTCDTGSIRSFLDHVKHKQKRIYNPDDTNDEIKPLIVNLTNSACSCAALLSDLISQDSIKTAEAIEYAVSAISTCFSFTRWQSLVTSPRFSQTIHMHAAVLRLAVSLLTSTESPIKSYQFTTTNGDLMIVACDVLDNAVAQGAANRSPLLTSAMAFIITMLDTNRENTSDGIGNEFPYNRVSQSLVRLISYACGVDQHSYFRHHSSWLETGEMGPSDESGTHCVSAALYALEKLTLSRSSKEAAISSLCRSAFEGDGAAWNVAFRFL